MAAHLQEPSIVETLLADEDGRHRRLHVVVDAALAGALEQSECPVVGVEHHLLRLPRISSHEQHAAMAEPDVRHLHGHRRAVQQDDLVAPVELVGFTWREAQRHIGRSRRGAALLAPPSGVAPHGVVAAGITAATQFLEQADQRQALPRRLTFIHRQQLIELVAPGSDPRKRLRFPLVAELSRLRTDDLPHDLPGNTEITAYRLDRLTVNEIRPTDLSNRLHDQHSNLGPHENGSQCGPSVPGSRLNADHPENGVLIPCRNTSHPPLRLVRQRQSRRDDRASTRTPGPGRACVRRSRRDRSGDRPANRPALPLLGWPHVCHRDLRARLPATTPSNRASRRNQNRHLMSADAASRTRIVKRASRWSKPSHGDARPNSDPSALSTALSVMKIILFAAQAGPRPTSGHYHVAATLLRLASTAIKSP